MASDDAMSTTDAIADLEQAAKRVEAEIDVEEAKPNGGSLWRRMNLNDARLHIGRALDDLRKCERVPSPNAVQQQNADPASSTLGAESAGGVLS